MVFNISEAFRMIIFTRILKNDYDQSLLQTVEKKIVIGRDVIVFGVFAEECQAKSSRIC